MKKRKRKKNKVTRTKVMDSLLLEMVQYLLDDNFRLKRILAAQRRHEGKVFGGASHRSASQQ
mgnify:CR=1 FL=1